VLHYLIPLNPTSLGRFDPNLWSAYVRANMAFANKLVEVRWRWSCAVIAVVVVEKTRAASAWCWWCKEAMPCTLATAG
jgi:hypothetical protein